MPPGSEHAVARRRAGPTADTLAVGATSLTAPLTLEPTYFSRPSFVPGKYILRCSGLNDHHQPVTYADRDFNVMAADQTTGTGAATGHGTTVVDPRYKVNVAVSFTPDRQATDRPREARR